MSTPDSLAPNPLAAFPRLPATASLLTADQRAFALAWGAEDDFGEPLGNVLGGDWNPAGFGGPGPVGPTGGGGPAFPGKRVPARTMAPAQE